MDWTISDGSGGEACTLGRAESKSEVEIGGKPEENQSFRDELFRETDFIVFMDWTISDGSGGESYTVGRAESESEVEITGKPKENQKQLETIFLEKPMLFTDY